jgi:Holliday junction resolvasome RuvABC endonuclease subunit
MFLADGGYPIFGSRCAAGILALDLAASKRGLKYLEANNASVRKQFIGKGSGDWNTLKAMTLPAWRELGWNSKNDDEADVFALLDYACHLLKLPVPWSAGGLSSARSAA